MSAALVLAAGQARRFGSQKLVALLDGQPLVRRTVDNVLASTIENVLVVVGREGDAVAEALVGQPVKMVRNPNPERGMSSSIRVGVSALGPEAEEVFIVLGDQPTVGPGIFDRMLGVDPRKEADIVVPVYEDGQANPVLFRSRTFRELLELKGDEGARTVVERDPDRVLRVRFDCAIPSDVDTREDLRRLTNR